MFRSFLLAGGLLAITSTCRAEDAISPEIMLATKQASVYIQVEGTDWSKSGSGFVAAVNGKDEFGKQFGENLTGSVTLKAKDGYAIGAISGKADLWCHGFSVTYMKVKKDGTLDPKDNYESEWVGWNGSMKITKAGGDGTPVVGIVGKIVGAETTALGLLFKGQESFDPNMGEP